MAQLMAWNGNWAWSIPLIALTVMLHAVCFAYISERIQLPISLTGPKAVMKFALVMGRTTIQATVLHTVEAMVWAAVYFFLGALPDRKSALLYSLGAMTTYGHEQFELAPHYQLMGALEALNGMILFGLTTAFLFANIQKIWREKPHHK
jgi:hypothetical protein